jgi:2-polyprenyl-3-methyl-5-hydroxy-6-metoxy-1,4-benzoquinol methylase
MSKMHIIDLAWDASELEHVDHCSFCGSANRNVAFKDVQDWSFYCAPGKWTYWDCIDCGSLYLDPRPKEAYIHKAYTKYYTHESLSANLLDSLKLRLKNEIIAKKYGVKLRPNLCLPNFFRFFLGCFNDIISEPYGIPTLKLGSKGRIVDVGCGSGLVLSIAKEYGWDVLGLEFDEAAAKAANKKNIPVLLGGYEGLNEYSASFDIIYCSHVLEHVYRPKEMLLIFKKALKKDGKLLLCLPNSQSFLRGIYGLSWRGIEAPRHIVIPSINSLVRYLNEIGFSTQVDVNRKPFTRSFSHKIAKKNSISVRKLNFDKKFIDINNQDFTFITCQFKKV